MTQEYFIEEVRHDIKAKRSKLHLLAHQIMQHKIEIKALESRRDLLREEIYSLSELIPKMEKAERRRKIVSERL